MVLLLKMKTSDEEGKRLIKVLKRPIVLIILLDLVFSYSANAQFSGQEQAQYGSLSAHSVRPALDLNYYGHRGKPDYQINNRNSQTEIKFQQVHIPLQFEQMDLLPATLAVAAMSLIVISNTEKKILTEVQSHQSEENDRLMNFGRRFGEDLAQKLILGSLVLGVVLDEDKKMTELVPVELKAILAAGLANNLLKIIFRRALPGDSPNNPYATANTSRPPDLAWPSGHTTSAIVAATIAAHNLERFGPLVPALLYTAAAVTGISRIYHDQHWATDVIASVYSYYLTKSILDGEKSTDPKYKWVVGPSVDPRNRNFGFFAQLVERPAYKPCGSKYSGGVRVEVCIRSATIK
jgi:hypothetical protein